MLADGVDLGKRTNQKVSGWEHGKLRQYITYKAALSDSYGDADGETADVPAEWFDYIAHGTYADFLRNDQQQDRAALAEQEAETILVKQLEKIGRQNGSSVFTRVVSNANTQWR